MTDPINAAVSRPNFAGNESKQSSGGYFTPMVLGAGVGGGATYFTKFGKKPTSVEDVLKFESSDSFVKTLKGEVAEENKAHLETLKKAINNQPKEAPKTDAKAADAKTTTAAATTEAKTPSKASEKIKNKQIKDRVKTETSNFFGESNTEITKTKLLSGKTAERFEETVIKPQVEINDKLAAEITEINDKYASNNYKLEQSKANLIKQEEIKNTVLTKEEKATEKALQGELKVAKEELTAAQKKIKEASIGLPNDELQALKDEMKQKAVRVSELKKEARPAYKKVAGEFVEEQRKAYQEMTEAKEALADATESAKEAKSEALRAQRSKAPDAATKKEVADQLQKDANEKKATYNSKKATFSETKELIKENLNPNAEQRIASAKTRIVNSIDTEKTLKQQIKLKTETLEKGLNNQAVLENRLDLAKSTTEEKIARATFKEKLSAKLGDVKVADATKSSAGESKVAEAVTKAYDAIKGHLPTKANWGKIGIGAAIGAVVFMIGKAMFGGKKEAPQAGLSTEA